MNFLKKTMNPLFNSWRGMIYRCYHTYDVAYKYYGGRGIRVCDEWKYSFECFVNDMAGTFQKGLTLDRIESNGNYEPSNCRWLTRKQQARNRRDNAILTYKDETKTVREWAEIMGISHTGLLNRLRKWNIEESMNKPIDTRHLNKVKTK